MKDELMVETEGVYHSLDLGESTNVTLKYNSNIFTDISKIVSNNSYTIKAPLTSKNRKIMDSPEMPMYESNFIHKKHTAQYFRNGLQIIKNAQIVLLSSTDTYELALTWGNISRFADMVNRGETLNELSGNDFIVWNQQFSGMDHGDFFIPFIYYGIETSPGVGDLNKNIFQHPVVKVNWILEKIQSDNNIVLLFPDDKKEFINRLIVPLLSKEDSQEIMNEYPIRIGSNGIHDTYRDSEKGINLKLTDSTQLKYGSIVPITWGNFDGTLGYQVNYDSNGAHLSCSLFATVPKPTTSQPEFIKITTFIIEPYTELFSGGYSNIWMDDNYYHLTYTFEIDFNFLKDQTLAMIIWTPGDSLSGIEVDLYAELKISNRGEVYTGEKYPIQINLPKIKQIDFIKAICNILGLFAIPVEGSTNTIKLVTLDAIYDNKPKAYDWTKKIIRAQAGNKPKEIKYSLSDFARTNWFRYKKDDTVKGNYDGAINVYDDSLDKEKDMVTLPFAASDSKNYNGIAIVPLYSYKEDTEKQLELEYSECEPRILLESNDGSLPIGVFTGLDFNTLIDTNYSKYREVVANPKIIKEKVSLTNYELMSLDLTVPVYFYQYARYYAIISIQANQDNICECELLQL